MSVNVTFSTFSKRENSTKQNSSGVTKSCLLKDPCSVLNPVVRVTITNPSAYNYAYIADFGRYYYVQDWISETSDIWEAHLRVDAMASWKSYIIAQSHYVLRSASDYDEDIVDSLYPTNGNVTIDDGTGSEAAFSQSDIISVIGLLNDNTTNKFGAAQLYVLSETEQGKLMAYLMGTATSGVNVMVGMEGIITAWASASDELKQGIAKSLAEPGQYITESYMLPYHIDCGNDEQLKAGYFTISAAQGAPVQGTATLKSIKNITLTLPDHPQAATRGKYLNLDPYSRYWLYLGPFGVFPLDSSMVYNDRTITIPVYGDLNGNICCRIMIGGHPAAVLHANVKCNFPVAQTNISFGQAVGAANSAVLSAARLGMGDAGAIISGISSIASAAEASMPKLMSQGAQGTFVNVFDAFNVYGEFHEIVDDMNAERGRPLCKEKTLSTLSGFCMCADAEVSAPCTKEEAAEINSYLNTGFYIE